MSAFVEMGTRSGGGEAAGGSMEEDAMAAQLLPSSVASRRLAENSKESVEESYSIEDAIEHLGFGKFQAGLLAYTGLSWLADAMEMILLSYVGPAARCEWGLTGRQEGLLSSAVFLGVFIGAYLWGIISDLNGRRLGYFITAAFTFFFGLLSAWAPYYWMLLLFRMLVGFGLGGAPVILSLFSEFLPSSSRGFWLVFIEFFWTVGAVLEAVLAWAVMPNLHWRWLVLISAFPFLGLLMFYPLLSESPRYLLVKGDRRGAEEVLKRVARVNGKSLPEGRLVLSTSPGMPNQALPSSSTETRRDINPKISKSLIQTGRAVHLKRSGAWGKLSKLVSGDLLRSSLVLWTVFFACAFAYYGQVLLTTQLAVAGDGSDAKCQPKNTTNPVEGRSLLEMHHYFDGLHLIFNTGNKLSRIDNETNTRYEYQQLEKAATNFATESSALYDLRLAGRHLASVNGQCGEDGTPNIADSTYLDVLITSCAELPGLIAALLIVDRLGRKRALMLLLLLSGLFLVPLWATLSSIISTTLLFGARACIMGSFAIIWALAPELYPTDVRTTGVGVGNAWSRLGGVVCPFVAIGLVANCHRAMAIFLFAGVPVAAAIASAFFPKETKGHVLTEEAPPLVVVKVGGDEEAPILHALPHEGHGPDMPTATQ